MLNILMLVSEAAPYSKTGGLGDVGGALPSALAQLGHRVTLATPCYPGSPGGREVATITSDMWPGAVGGRVLELRREDEVRVWFVDYPPYFSREGIYGMGGTDYPDNDRRFAFFVRAVLETAARTRWMPSVVHAHDWQTGLTPVYARHRYAYAGFDRIPTVFTIHNLAYQGLFDRDCLGALDVDWNTFTSDGLEFWGRVSFLKAGINFSTIITTVSRRYAREIQMPECGCGFDGILRRRSNDLVGIPNGIDTRVWDPETDPFLPVHFSARDLSGKAALKARLRERVGLDGQAPSVWPMIGMVNRMVDQKGLDLVASAASDLMKLEAQFVVLGTGERHYEELWRSLAREHPDRVAVTIGFDEALAHLIEGGADVFLMPSQFEPCGLNQMYSLRYGTVPVVRATGGLDDTVEQFDPATGRGTGFKFGPYTPAAMLAALNDALRWFAKTEIWRRIQVAGMGVDHSWQRSAREYEGVYDRALAAAGDTRTGADLHHETDRR
jgi:starch synthase